MNAVNQMIMKEYHVQKQFYEQLGEVVSYKVKGIVKEESIPLILMEHRVKKEDSLAGKLFRKPDKYKQLSDLTDILGLRIVCYFSDDVDRIGKLLVDEFSIDWDNSVDKRALMKVDSFGYLSLHYIATLRPDCGEPEQLLQRKFEIQIQTGLQYVWNKINHDIGYKSKYGTPRSVTREFSRLAGLLELADLEFMRVRDDMNEYGIEIHQRIVDGDSGEVDINLVSLREYMTYNKDMKHFLNRLAKIEDAEITLIDCSNYIDQLAWLGLRTIGGLQQMLHHNADLAYQLAYRVLHGSELDIVSSNIGLRYLCQAELIRRDFSKEQMVGFIMLTVSDHQRAEKQVERLLRVKEELSQKE